MRRRTRAWLAAAVVLAAAGFALASIASGGMSILAASTVTQTVTVVTTQPGSARKVVICHHRSSRKKPFVTISVSSSALGSFVRRGDAVGRCTPAKIRKIEKFLKAKARAHAAGKGGGKKRH